MVEVFEQGMHTKLDRFWYGASARHAGECLNLGAGRKHIEDAIPLDAENGWFAGEPMPAEDCSITAIYAHHFLEHLTKDEVISVLRECERVLLPYGIINIVVPHFTSEQAHHDLDHKTTWTESTFRQLLTCPYYDGTMPRKWLLRERQTLLMGLVQRNLVVVSQLYKVNREEA